ncbi:lysophospholipid acyltransferase family protein [Aestuariibacter salexigens]|uniref:lysophospholipid acyltransferase family protein n=1 Tax=Aestuariibacter salexigens TaxID=226010 RepID=UPI00047E0547|nr:lysophospholipid acyltransferase family protein [Aestuariibacter salexigens]
MSQRISLLNLIASSRRGRATRFVISLVDSLLGIRRMDALYRQHNMQGLSKEDFADRLLQILDINLQGLEALTEKIPRSGPLLIASNHPFGGLEGVILARYIATVRPDLKVLANQGLKLFPELNDYFIYTDPLAEGNPKNAASLRQSVKHLKQQGALLIFPAGRVSYFRQDKGRITDHHWNRITGTLIQRTQAAFLPVFVDGLNSPLFYRLGRVYYRFRLLMLARELLNKQGATISIACGSPVPSEKLCKQADSIHHTVVCRALCYAQSPQWRYSWPPDAVTQHQPLAAPVCTDTIERELALLPAHQHLFDYKHFAVYYGTQQQLPNTVRDIARLRELVFRQHNEGSGAPIDTDHFDATYTQLFAYDRKSRRLIGAYRMGQTDHLLKKQGLDGLYLSRMFDFQPDFINQQQPCLELGRSFLIPEYQRSYQGLYLLWRGIGAFVCKFPCYRTLYGTVSLSKLYDPRSVALIREILVQHPDNVNPRFPFMFDLHPECRDAVNSNDMTSDLSALLAGIETDGKDIPVLLRHYMKLGARFHALGLDKNFNDTPGLLLSVDLDNAPVKLMKLYMGNGFQQFYRS